MIFINKLFIYELLKELRCIYTCIFVTTNQGAKLDSLDIRNEVLKRYYKLRCVCVLAIFNNFCIRRNL